MSRPVLGAQLYTTRKLCQTIEGVAETFAKVRKIGYAEVQISAFGPVDPKDVAKALEDNALKVASTHMKWDRFCNDLDAVIEEHHLWNCKHPAVGNLPDEYRTPDGLRRFLDELPGVTEKLAAEGMDFSYHTHSWEMVRYGEKTWLEMLFEKTDPKDLKAELDTYWIQYGGGDPVTWIRRCAGRQPLLHLKDMVVTASLEQRQAEIGEGNLNWTEILRTAEEGGVEHALIEQDNCYDRDPFECLAISYRNLNQMGFT